TANALVAAQKARGVTMSINSGLRTLPQQYLLYRWYQTGRCGIGLAAKPGNSNHESGIAVDINDNASWRSAMNGKGFQWLGSSDPVHFDFRGGGTVSMKGLSVRAFQRLWNRNNPNDKISEDGVYGPATEARLSKAPVGGFAQGALCTQTMAGPMDEEAPPVGEPDEDFVPTPDATEPAVEGTNDERTTASATLPSSTDGNGTAAEGCSVTHRSTTGPSLGSIALGLLGTGLVVRRRRRR
ncbi:MAG: hypothetical protein K0S65_6198, partial [Labilithrix sp.]|nr:hypothetical protein [Labilithrix sp.]